MLTRAPAFIVLSSPMEPKNNGSWKTGGYKILREVIANGMDELLTRVCLIGVMNPLILRSVTPRHPFFVEN